jgi:uncharacterized protein
LLEGHLIAGMPWTFADQLAFSCPGSTGSTRMRFPVAAKIALQIAGAIGGTPGSPTPPGGASLSTM